MYPGQNGFGTGIGLADNAGLHFNLIAIYEQTAAVRNQPVRLLSQFARASSVFILIQHHQNRNAHEQSLLVDGAQGSLKPRVQQLCQSIDAFVCVVDATSLTDPATSQQRIAAYRDEIKQLLDPRWTHPQSPLLVLACSPTSQQLTASCAQLACDLFLGALDRPWQVRRACLDAYQAPIQSGLAWIVANTQ